MPADIRSFFGGKPAGTKTEPVEKQKPVVKRGARKVIEDDSDEDVVEPKKSTPKKRAPRKVKEESPKGEETTTSDYFASSKQTPAARSATSNAKKEVKSTTPAVKKKVTAKAHSNNVRALRHDEDDEGGDDIFADAAKNNGRGADDYVEVLSEDEEPLKPIKKTTRAKPATKTKVEEPQAMEVDSDRDFVVPDDDDDIKPSTSTRKPASRKRKSTTVDEEDEASEDLDEVSAKKTTAKKPAAKKPRTTKSKAAPEQDANYQAIMDAIPTIRAPTPPPKDDSAGKFDFRAGPKNAGPPPAAGSKEIPEGEESCLTGLKFVFTGVLESLQRDEAISLVKRYGGEVTGAPSGKTDFVVLGDEAGPSKLRKIEQLKVKTINEDGLLELIRRLPANGGSGVNAGKALEKKKKEEDAALMEAKKMEEEERKQAREAQKAAEKAAIARGLTPPPKVKPSAMVNTELWTKKYAPTQLNQICGNKGQVLKIQKWLDSWHSNRKKKFQMRGADGMGAERAIIIHGPPGIGKTTAAHLAANLAGFDVIESNASDTRSKKLVETGLRDVLNNNSLMGYFEVNGKDEDLAKKKIVLVLDEVDGMSAGDRGGVGALAKLCKTTSIPMILICNERKLPKMKPFDHVTFDLPFRRPVANEIRSRLMTIVSREGLKVPGQVLDALIEGTNKDIRQIINMLSTAKLDQAAMDFDSTKEMSKAWEKHVVLKPWDLCAKLLGSQLFAPSSKATLNDKIELYFNDHEFCPLMIQENYLGTKPSRASEEGGNEKRQRLHALELVEQAAAAISDGDLVDRMIHGSQQQWSLMPTHAVFSTVKPASLVYGGYAGGTAFTKWLGNNSKQQKLVRYVKELQSHMRLRTSGDRHEIRQQYLPVLWEKLVNRLQKEGKDATSEVIELMDTYFLTRDDFDYIMELGLGPQKDEDVKIDTQTKSQFTRLYNAQSHPMPFMKSSDAAAAPMKAPKKEVPDLEEAIEEEDDGEVVADDKPVDEDEELEKALKNDKFVAKPKKKPAAKAKPTAKKGKKAAEPDDDDEEEDMSDAKPAKKAAPKKRAPKKTK